MNELDLMSPSKVAEKYGGDKRRIAQAAQMGLLDPTVAVMAGMFIDRMRGAAAKEQTPQTTVAQDVMAQPAPAGRGLTALPAADNLYDEESFAGGGIVAFASRGFVDSPEDSGLESIRMGKRKHPYEDLIIQNALARNEDPTSDLEILYRETGAVPNAERALSSKGARGIMQIMPATAIDPGFGVPNIFELAKRRGIEVSDTSTDTAKKLLDNPELNAEFGSLYRSAMEKRFGGDKVLAAAAYNAGPGSVAKAGNNVPNIAETQKYVQGISPQRQNFLERQQDAARKVQEARREQLRSGVLGPIEGQSVIPSASVMEKEIKTPEVPTPPELRQVSGDLGSTFDPFLEATTSLTPEGYSIPTIPREQPTRQAKPTPVPVKPPQAKPEAQTLAEQAAQESKVSKPKTKEEATVNKLEELLSRREQMRKAQRSEDKNLALLAAGLGAMAGKSPYALANIGAGALKGIEQYGAARKVAAKEEEDILAGRLGQFRYGEESRLRAEDRRLDQGMRLASAEEARVRESYRKIMENVLDPRSKQLKEQLKQNPDLIDQLALDARNRVLQAYGIDIGQPATSSAQTSKTVNFSSLPK